MANPNSLNPRYPGKVTALGFGIPSANLINYALVKTQGLTTPVTVFGATAGFAGNFVGMRITAKDNANGTISLYTDNGTLVAAIAKGSHGAVKGSVFAAVAFTSSGTPYVVSSADGGDVDVEVMFNVTHE